MTVPAIDLDTLTWADLVALGRERLAPDSSRDDAGPRWTLHGPVDPGVTLLEVLAWQLEQRLFVMNQEPDGVVRNVLALLGVDGVRAARPAVTVLSLEPHSDRPVHVPVGRSESVVEATDTEASLMLATDHGVTLVPGLRVDRFDSPLATRVDPPGAGRPEALAGVALVHGASGPPPVEFSLLVEIEPARQPTTDQALDDEWLEPVGWQAERGCEPRLVVLDPDGVEREPIPPPPGTAITWSAEVAGERAVIAVIDGTGGLRHSGVVSPQLPREVAARWAPGTTLLLKAEATPAAFSFPPLVRAVHANAVVARHEVKLELRGEDGDKLVRGWVPLPDRTIELPGAAGRLVDRLGAATLWMVERDGVPHEWKATPDLGRARPGDRVFEIDRDAGALRFGDGRHGRIPRPGAAPSVRLEYAIGGGDVEGVAIGRRWRLVAECGIEAEGANVVPLGCGADPETLARARARAAQDVQRNQRLVTSDDYVDLAMRTPGVDLVRAQLVPRLDLANPCARPPDAVTVVCVPRAPRGPSLSRRSRVATPRLDPGTAAAIRRRFDESRLIGSLVDVTGPRYRRVRLRVDIAAGALVTEPIRAEIRRALAQFLDPVEGDADGTGWRVGRPIAPADLLARAQAVAGSTVDVLAVAVRLDDGGAESCDPVPLGLLDLPGISDSDVEIRHPGQAA
jgi:hypothetical protein